MLWQKLHCAVWTQFADTLGEKKKTKNFFSLDERRRATWPGSHLYHSCCLATQCSLCLLLSLVTCLRQNTGGTDSPGRRTPERVPLRAKVHHTRAWQWWALVPNHRWHCGSVMYSQICLWVSPRWTECSHHLSPSIDTSPTKITCQIHLNPYFDSSSTWLTHVRIISLHTLIDSLIFSKGEQKRPV